LWLNYEALPENSRDDYFPPGVLPLLPDQTTFIDCGAYDGDTIQLFLLHQEGRFHEILAFEPDPANCQKLRDYVSTLEAEVAGRIHIYNAGVGRRRTKMNFNSTGNMGAALDEAGELEVDVLALDDVVRAAPTNTLFVKFDIEGGEWAALKGMQKLFETSQPFLAISVYHRPDDLWQLPLYLKTLNPAYRLFLRTQGEDGMDVICYALP
jgi:FkbM family methyltransferase